MAITIMGPTGSYRTVGDIESARQNHEGAMEMHTTDGHILIMDDDDFEMLAHVYMEGHGMSRRAFQKYLDNLEEPDA